MNPQKIDRICDELLAELGDDEWAADFVKSALRNLNARTAALDDRPPVD